ncbi:hypothetical protein LTR10_001859 [Elasticomyces elasticus]|nr:hypothetical protein LTR10_001859 [Elasticomyces elasticus]
MDNSHSYIRQATAYELLSQPNANDAPRSPHRLSVDSLIPARDEHDVDQGHTKLPDQDHESGHHRSHFSPKHHSLPAWLPARNRHELLRLAVVLTTLIPIVLLAVYAPRLSEALGAAACLPNGDFIFPGQASIWDPKYFFTVSITIGYASGWNYTHVKILDVCWDVIVGRGGQILLIYIASRVFASSLAYLMESRPVGFEAYGTVAFSTGSMSSIIPYLRALVSKRYPVNRLPSTWKPIRIFTMFALATIYIAAMPTLYSAMTGYAVVSGPALVVPPVKYQMSGCDCAETGGCATFPCGGPGASIYADAAGGFKRGFGVCQDCERVELGDDITIPREDDAAATRDIEAYFKAHQADYDAAAADATCQRDSLGKLPFCAPLNKTSTFQSEDQKYKPYTIDLPAPLLDILTWGENAQTGSPNSWLCNGVEYKSEWFSLRNVTGTCQAGGEYQWGFSYLLLFSVCIAQSLFAVMIYALWVEAHRYRTVSAPRKIKETYRATGHEQWRDGDYPSTLSSAVNMVRQAEAAHGHSVTLWCARKLDDVIWRGEEGMRAARLPDDGYEIVH